VSAKEKGIEQVFIFFLFFFFSKKALSSALSPLHRLHLNDPSGILARTTFFQMRGWVGGGKAGEQKKHTH
jgi:hypothetical protein